MTPKRVVACAVAFLLAVSAGVLGGFAAPEQAHALDGSQFDPTEIISDDNFYNPAAMTQAEIQAFLSSKAGCGNSLCLSAGQFPSSSKAADAMCQAYSGGGTESAAAIIFKVQQACSISAKVILVTLQKEQSLVTTSSPSTTQINKAMGYACPDTSACDTTYYGLFNQVYSAAHQFVRYGNPPGTSNYFTWFPVGSPSVVAYTNIPPPRCAAAPAITIKNKATAALYYYTPYRPNAEALANLYGGGNECSSYGNRNFWVYYNQWFGSTISDGPLLIAQKYAAYGGAAGTLGAVASPVLTIAENGGGLGQAYANGSIYWNINAGAHVVLAGALRDFYFASSGASGPYGWPLSDTEQLTANGGGYQQAFSAGALYASPSGAYLVSGSTRLAYFARNGALGDLGWPVAARDCTLTGGGCVQKFQSGSIYTNPGGSAYAVVSLIDGGFAAAGGPSGSWGYPSSNPLPISSASGDGVGQVFTGGSAYSRTGSTAYLVSGAIRDFYFAKGGATGTLGWPAGAAACSADGTSCSQLFTGGTVSWTKAGGATVTAPQIDSTYASQGGATGSLGPAKSDLIWIPQNGGGLGKAYTTGSIYWSVATGASVVAGGIRDAYFGVNGSAGALGWPTGAAVCGFSGNGCSQPFQANAIIAGRPATGYYTVTGAYTTALIAAGGTTGVLGLPTSTQLAISSNGGGTGQVFDGGSIYSSAAGTYAVSGGIRTFYFSKNGAAGPVGWPAGAMACTASACTQKFTGGTVTWSSAAGGSITP